MSELVFLNGRLVARGQAVISIDDRGFLFGDAVYEVIRVARGRFVDAELHLDRLARSLAALSLATPALDPLTIALDLLRRNGLAEHDAVVYLQVSRGAAVRQHAFPPADVPATVLMTATPFAPRRELLQRGATAIVEPDLRWSRCDIKSVNLLPNVLAAQRAAEAGAFEAILVRDGVVTEATRSNVFAVVDGVLRTHPTGPRILPGVTRAVVLELAREAGIALREDAMTAQELGRATEVFVTGTTSDVMPIIALGGRNVGDGSPGPTTRRLGAMLSERIEAAAAF